MILSVYIAGMAKPSCSQFLIIESATYVYAQDQFTSYLHYLSSNEPIIAIINWQDTYIRDRQSTVIQC